MVDPGLARGMAEWVAGHVLRYHLGIDAHLRGQDGVWRNGVVPPLARERSVGLLGLGEIGRAVRGDPRRPRLRPAAAGAAGAKELPGIAAHTGEAGLEAVLASAEILVALLPATPETENLLDAARPGAAAAGRPADQRRPRQPDRRRRAPRRARRGPPRPRDPRRLPRRAAAARPPVLGAPPRHRHPARRRETRPETAAEAIARNIRPRRGAACPSSTSSTAPPATEPLPGGPIVLSDLARRVLPAPPRRPRPQDFIQAETLSRLLPSSGRLLIANFPFRGETGCSRKCCRINPKRET